MSDRFDVLERFAPLFEAPEPSFDAFLRRRDRKRRNQRITAGVVGIAVFLAAIWLVTSGGPLDRTQRRPGGPGPAETGPSVTGPVVGADFEGVGFIGLPPEGAAPSTPVRGQLVFRFMFLQGTGDAGRFGGAVYEDGRLIWWRLGPPENPDGTEQRSHLERRLSPEDVELLRAELSSSGLFDRDRYLLSAEGLHAGDIDVADGDGLTSVSWGDCCPRPRLAEVTATAEQANTLRRLEERLNALAWEEGEVEAFVASGYTLCLETEQDVGFARLLGSLPRGAEDLIRSWDLTYRTSADPDPDLPYYTWCSAITTGQARALARTLDEAGMPQSPFGDEVVYDVNPRNPDETYVAVAFYPLLPHQV
jgi:hypothetical protein